MTTTPESTIKPANVRHIEVLLYNGRRVKAPTEEWVAAILSVLSDDQKAAVFQRIEQKLVAYRTPGQYVLHAEPGRLGFMG